MRRAAGPVNRIEGEAPGAGSASSDDEPREHQYNERHRTISADVLRAGDTHHVDGDSRGFKSLLIPLDTTDSLFWITRTAKARGDDGQDMAVGFFGTNCFSTQPSRKASICPESK